MTLATVFYRIDALLPHNSAPVGHWSMSEIAFYEKVIKVKADVAAADVKPDSWCPPHRPKRGLSSASSSYRS